MELGRFLARLCSLLLIELVVGIPLETPYYFQRPPTTPCNITAEQVRRELGTNLSNTTTIFGPSDARWPNATARWDILEAPDIQVVVQVGQEEDISKVVRLARYIVWIFRLIALRSDTAITEGSNSSQSVVAIRSVSTAWKSSLAFRSI